MTVGTFESCLIRYHVLGQRLNYSDFVLNRLALKLDSSKIRKVYTEDEKDEAEKLGVDLHEFALTSRICFDFNVVQLFSLLEAHYDMLTHLNTTVRINLEKYLSSAWQVVEARTKWICKWMNNNNTAHGKSFAKDGSFIVMPDTDPDYFQGQIELFKASKCAIIYISGFLKNTPEYESAMSTYRSKTEGIKTMTSQPFLQIDVDPILEKVKKTLKDNGLDTDFHTKLRYL
jgi:hypothetical protein